MIEARNLGFRFGGGPWVFRGLDVTVEPSSITSLLGSNGVGKSTLLRLLAGISEPSEGSVSNRGQIGFVPQATAGVFPYLVSDMVLMGRARRLGMFSQPGAEDRRIAAEALDRVGMAHLASRPFTGLSGGQQQLILIARALATGCDTLILDEPVSALDLRNQAMVLELLSTLRHEGLAVVLSTHSPEHALHLGGQALVLDPADGLRAGPAGELLSDDVLTRLYGIDLFRVTVPDGERPRNIVVTRYEGARDAVAAS